MWDMVGNVSAGGGIAGWLCVCSGVGGRVWLVYAAVMYSSSDPGGGGFVMAVEGIEEMQGVSPVVVVCGDALVTSLVVVHGKIGGGSGGGRAVA